MQLNIITSGNPLLVQAIESLELSSVAMRVKYKEQDFSDGTLRLAERDYLRFLFLKLSYPQPAIIPTKLIDLFWEAHILDSVKYSTDSAMLCASMNLQERYIHHAPIERPETPMRTADFDRLNSLFLRHFGNAPFDFFNEFPRHIRQENPNVDACD